jgi:hypothetical protein
MSKTIKLNFDGYCQEAGLPPPDHDCAGIYVVYAGQHTAKDQCKLRELLYIGRSGDIAKRPGPLHHKCKDWCRRLRKETNEVLYFSFADTDDEERAEPALIYKVKPVCNDTGKDGFHHQETTIITSGSNEYIGYPFTVRETD